MRPATPDPGAMSSLERVELLTELEAKHGIEIDEEAFMRARTAEELHRFMTRPVEAEAALPLAAWPLSWPARMTRTLFQRGAAIPLFRHYLPLRIDGMDNLLGLTPPAIFAANHTSHLDTPAVYAALPAAWRKRLAPAVRAEYFRPHFEPSRFALKAMLSSRFQYGFARLFYNCYPLPQEMTGVRRALRYTADLIRRGYCPLVYPEGQRTPDGSLQTFRPGIGMMAVRLRVPVVPLYIAGLFDVYSLHHSWPARGPVRVRIGKPVSFASTTTFEEAAHGVEHAIRQLAPRPA